MSGAVDLEFGLFDWVDARPGRSVAETYDDRLRVLAEADRGGFSTHHLAEHHGTPLGLSPSPAVFLAAAARATAGIRLAPTTVTAQVAEAVTTGEVNYLAGAFAWGSLEPAPVLDSVRLFRDEVVPAVREFVGARRSAVGAP